MILATTNKRIIRPYDKPSFEHTQRYGLVKGHWANTNRVGFWPFNEGSGNIVQDLSGDGNTGTLVADTHWVPGPFGPTLSFDGTGDYVDCGTMTSIEGVSQVTFMAWVRCSVTPTDDNSILGKMEGAGWKMLLYVNDQPDLRFIVQTDGEVAGTGSKPWIDDQEWHHVAGTYDGSFVNVYIDGVVGTPDALAGLTRVIDGNLQIGSRKTDRFWNGLIDSPMVYNRALIASEITQSCREPFLGIERRIAPVYFFVPTGGVVYQELNLTVTADASTTKTDTHQMVETGKAVQADAGAIETDTHQMVETGKEVSAGGSVSCTDLKVVFELGLGVSADASVTESDTQQMIDTGKAVEADAAATESDTQQMVDTGKEVSAAASVSCTEIKVVFELNLTVTAAGNVVATDAHTMIETGKSVTAVASPAVIDTQAMVETGLGVLADGSVSCIDTMGLLAHIAAFMILRQCTT